MILPLLVMTGMTAGAPLLQSNLQQGAPVRQFAAVAVSGAPVRSTTLRGRSNVLFFFCPCIECRRVAEGWSGLQQKKALNHPSLQINGKSPGTWVVYAGSKQDTRAYIHTTGLQVANGVADPEFALAKTFRAMPCPTILVTDSNGIVRYASKERAGELQSDAGVLLQQTLETLRTIKAKPKTTAADRMQLVVSSPRLSVQPMSTQSLQPDGTLVDPVMVPADTEAIVREYWWTNKTAKPIEVEQLLTSCGCEQATLIQGGKVVKRARIEPDGRVMIRLEFAMTKHDHAKVITAWLFSTSIAPIATVRVEARRAD